MELAYGKCRIQIIEDKILYRFEHQFAHNSSWKLELIAGKITHVDLKTGKKKVFLINEIKEFLFEVNGDHRANQIVTASAYVVLKTDPDPVKFFTLFVDQEFILTNQTKAYDFCFEILKFIGGKYNVPYTYKLFIDTKEKTRSLWVLPVIFIIIVVIWIVRGRLHR